MTDEEIKQQFIRVSPSGDRLEVLVISWDGHTPVDAWVNFELLPEGAGRVEIEAATEKALGSKRFFRRCRRCKQLKPLGWMNDSKMCQSCAEQFLGVVY